MERVLAGAIERQARKLINREGKSVYLNKKYQRRFRLRSGNAPTIGAIKSPGHWQLHPHFDPAYCIKHAKFLARTIWKKVLEEKYKPIPAVKYSIPKDSGGTRDIMVFGIPDTALANLINRKLRDRNQNILSPFCFFLSKNTWRIRCYIATQHFSERHEVLRRSI